ncbi:bifunctional diaminohydroxyphosphoribosylaminopyrimidine deaminase/5-amino-6-(5-phosphoribosylamino)uracil reductase RibD [Alkalihalobacillus sp. AL-G]|uniref:bifunctional diaminohydroxyphosphoribosylaminopyrimidine deaminase/5-amino-6-(5-phosphoribosylamino)uracil reductase RibD n=1 Tax=Alkalihalobacillus sp. AL-G TaxID=2926399 RepID=UPI00272AC5BB|nr:bifunctional diaminohydroxyphosphoribosylaminopyrimidine deaminase/5-amino-6-(5-phosphoribosylamino)uracil reductase RibD [Alkalihalobacillus sp. AL-G]WLD91886.1 bifunctional diaminohydroxyphosphoribosylaminopyrimidine deaminase/5-amino-6-(5-phosphoribosylamino)uracil reductase RibD [Alkalihalobacillus sp. AL-G]
MDHQQYMRLAIEMAKNTRGQTSPNPSVGAVVVKNGQIAGLGAHLKPGEGHAEVHALHMAGEKAKGATMYVTLEPCSHHGKTPPCADLVINSGVETIYIGTLDPNPLVAGRGMERLKKAGLNVHVGLMQKEAIELNPFFNHFMKTGLPYVTLKFASSLDGKIATETGHSKWITGKEARQDTHLYRHKHDAILVGVKTVFADDPSLTTRLPQGGKNPIRIVLDSNLRIPLESKLLTDNAAETWVVTGALADKNAIQAIENKGARIIQLGEEKINIKKVLRYLADEKITSLFVEGGATVHGSFLQESCVQQVISYIAPMLIGGKQAPSSIGGSGVKLVDDAFKLEIQSCENIGKDLKIILTPKGESSCSPESSKK